MFLWLQQHFCLLVMLILNLTVEWEENLHGMKFENWSYVKDLNLESAYSHQVGEELQWCAHI